MQNQDFLLEMEGISKSFSGVHALRGVQLKVKKGSVHSLMGENGSGKSTLMKILLGLYSADNGSIRYKGELMRHFSVGDALHKGITMIHQELMSVPEMTVADNIFLGKELSSGGVLQEQKQYEALETLFADLGVHINPKAKIKSLSTAQVQLVEMAKALSYNADLIIMDEPTSALSETEADNLLSIVKRLRDRGVSVIYITHKMDEVFKIADEITVLRDGENIITKPANELNNDSLISYMVGRALSKMYPKNRAVKGAEMLRVESAARRGEFRDISFSVQAGEILGFAGLMGAGRSELINSLFGITKLDQGSVYIKGKKVDITSTHTAIAHGVGLVTEDRKLTGIFPPLSLVDNMVMPSFSRYSIAGFFNRGRIFHDCSKLKSKMAIKASSLQQTIGSLSGGNQQKVLLARWMMRDDIEILIIDEPTRGIDVNAKYEIHQMLCDLAGQGKAIIMVSSEMPEIIGMSDRVLVMCEGRLKAELRRDEATQENIMRHATAFTN
jgi:ABC-type sugar transport system, ATPase component